MEEPANCSASAVAMMVVAGIGNAQDQAVEAVVVTGIRATLAQGLENKPQSTEVVESIIAEGISNTPGTGR